MVVDFDIKKNRSVCERLSERYRLRYDGEIKI